MFTAHVFIVPMLLFALIGVHLLILVRQKHSQFPGPGRTEHNVVGSRLWPAYTVRTLGLFTAVLAVLFALGGLAQINPVWIYGPFEPAQSTIPSQPDWYVAWGEGALRLFPALDIHMFGHLIPTPFFPAVALGGVAFLALYAWPFLDEWARHDRADHQLLDRPRDHPVRMAVGVGALTFFGLLLLAASDDVVADWFGLPVNAVVWMYRILVLAMPPIAAVIAYLLSRSLRGVQGGFSELTASDLATAVKPPPAQTHESDESEHRYLDVAPDGHGRWLWRFVELDETNGAEYTLESTNRYPSRETARAAAGEAYPALAREPVVTLDDGEPTHEPSAAGGTAQRTLSVAMVLVVLSWIVSAVRRR